MKEKVLGIIDSAVKRFDNVISGDKTEPLNDTQKAQKDRWFRRRDGMKKQGIDVTWKDPRS